MTLGNVKNTSTAAVPTLACADLMPSRTLHSCATSANVIRPGCSSKDAYLWQAREQQVAVGSRRLGLLLLPQPPAAGHWGGGNGFSLPALHRRRLAVELRMLIRQGERHLAESGSSHADPSHPCCNCQPSQPM